MIVGIDLGTSNCALAFVDPARGPGAGVETFEVWQGVRPHEDGARPLLPSAVYLPAEHERGDLGRWVTTSPGPEPVPRVVGELARWLGARVPARLVTSAKSWLCHTGVDRQAAILPWGATEEVQRLSPVEASAQLLRHLAQAWDAAHPDLPLEAQETIITVPASFDEAARALTVTAARRAGLSRFVLLEEPQAAFYDFTARHRATLSQTLEGVRLVLVVDIGGGTTDFTLVQVEAQPEGPAMRRIAVGEHLMLGGDNMDAALAHLLEPRLGAGRRLSQLEWAQLVQSCRSAKEQLLARDAPEVARLAVATSGSRLVGGTTSLALTRADVEQLVIEGFFPPVGPEESPRRSARGAIQELGLPYASDPAITRHLCAFLRNHALAARAALGGGAADGAEDTLPRPDAILLNGGVFNSPRLADVLVERVSALFPGQPRVRLLEHSSLDLAVARGAAHYGLTRHGLGRRIGGGAARSYYVALSVKAGEAPSYLCLIPRGFEEGSAIEVSQRTFSLTLNLPVQFQLFTSNVDRLDATGDVVTMSPEQLHALPPIHTILKATTSASGVVPVHLTAGLTEIGTLELSCVSAGTQERWRLEFELRGSQGRADLSVTESMPVRFGDATELVERVFGNKPLPVGPKDVKQLVRNLERALGPKESWRVAVLRELWGALFAGASKRRRSPDHERVFYQLLGFTLRPGFGYPLDAWRATQTFGLFADKVQHHAEKAVWLEYWILWRRVAGGLGVEAQELIHAYLMPHLSRRLAPPGARPREKLKGIVPEGLDEMVRVAASLEHLSPGPKIELGELTAEVLRREMTSGGPWAWALGRIGARAPLYGSAHHVVPAEVASAWTRLLLERGLGQLDGAPFAVTQLTRLTGDRARDVDDDLREAARQALVAARAPEAWLRMVTEVVELSTADEARALGDTLPMGLTLP